jgi:hypothetical protein
VRPPPARLDQNWPGLVGICRIERIRELKSYCERQVIHAITELPQQAASAERLLELCRAHWGIENRSFRVKDRTFAEDACRVRSGNAPIALAHLRARPDPPPRRQTKTRPRSLRRQSPRRHPRHLHRMN